MLAIVTFEDYVLSHSLDVCVGGTPCADHGRRHEDCLVGDNARDAIDVGLTQTCLLREAGTRLQGVDTAAQISIGHSDQLLDHSLRLQFDALSLANAKKTLRLGCLCDGSESKFDTSGG